MKQPRLFLGQVEFDFDPNFDWVLGSWSFLERQSLIAEYKKPFFKPFSSFEEIEQTEEYLFHHITPIARRRIGYFLFNQWKGIIDEDLAFFEYIIDPWLTHFCQNYWILYLLLKRIQTSDQEAPLIVKCLTKNSAPSFKTTSDFALSVWTDISIQTYFASSIAEILAKEKLWTLEYFEFNKIKNPKNDQFNILKSLIKFFRFTNYSKYLLRCSYSQFPYFYRFLLSFILSIKPVRRNNEITAHCIRNNLERNQDFFSSLSNEEQEVIQRMIEVAQITIPESFSHSLHQIWKKANRIKFKNGKCRIPDQGAGDIEMRVINYLAKKKGEVLIGIQHGGGHGSDRIHPLVQETEYRYDFYASWGWRSHDRYQVNALPMPSPLLSPISNKHRFKKDVLFFVNYSHSPMMIRLHSKPIGSDIVRELPRTVSFFEFLRADIRSHVLYRPHEKDGSLENPGSLKQKFPEIMIYNDSSRKFMKKILSCHLLVLNHPITTLHVAMAANIPTICYWDPNFWDFTKDCKNLFKEFKKLGILFDSPELAADKVNEVWSYIPTWWNDRRIQSVRQQWNAQFALADPGWKMIWLKALWRL